MKSEDYIYEEKIEQSDLLYSFATHFLNYRRRTNAQLVANKVTVWEVHILSLLATHPGITTTEAAKLRECTPGAISQAVSKLEKKGLALRKHPEGNAKVTCLFATEEGEALLQTHADQNRQDWMEIWKDYSKEEIEIFLKVLRKLDTHYR